MLCTEHNKGWSRVPGLFPGLHPAGLWDALASEQGLPLHLAQTRLC